MVQRDRASAVGMEQALARGHRPLRLEARPSFANILLWKIVYQAGERFYVDTVRVGAGTRFYPGESVPVLDARRHLAWLQPGSQQARDVERFRWFSNDYLAPHPEDPLQVIDMRFSLVPNQVDPLWTIRLDPRAHREQHVEYLVSRDTGNGKVQEFRRMLLGR